MPVRGPPGWAHGSFASLKLPHKKEPVPPVGQGAGGPLPIGCLLRLDKRTRHGSTVMSASPFSGLHGSVSSGPAGGVETLAAILLSKNPEPDHQPDHEEILSRTPRANPLKRLVPITGLEPVTP